MTSVCGLTPLRSGLSRAVFQTLGLFLAGTGAAICPVSFLVCRSGDGASYRLTLTGGSPNKIVGCADGVSPPSGAKHVVLFILALRAFRLCQVRSEMLLTPGRSLWTVPSVPNCKSGNGLRCGQCRSWLQRRWPVSRGRYTRWGKSKMSVASPLLTATSSLTCGDQESKALNGRYEEMGGYP